MSDCESSYAVEENKGGQTYICIVYAFIIAVVGEKTCVIPKQYYSEDIKSMALSIVTLYNRQSV